MKLLNFEKKLYNKHKNVIEKALSELPDLNLSLSMSRLLGPLPFEITNLDGFFMADTHDSKQNNLEKFRYRAISKLIKFIELDRKVKGKDDIINTFPNYSDRDEDTRKEVRETYLSINKKNITSIFNTIIHCDITNQGNGNKCKKENNLKFSVKNFEELFLPSLIFKTRFDFMLKEIVRHTLCDHNSKQKSCYHNIDLLGKNLIVEQNDHYNKCLFFLVIKILPTNDWLVNIGENELNKPSMSHTIFFNDSLLRYCDYLVIAPKGEFRIIPVATFSNEHFSWKELNNEQQIKLRTEETIFNVNNNKIYIYINKQNICIDICNKKEIFHILVFNNYTKVSGGLGGEQQTGNI